MLLDFSADYILENDRVHLTPLAREHKEALRSLAQEPRIWTYFLGLSDGSQNFDSYINRAIEARKMKKEYPFAVFDKKKGSIAGCTRFFEYQEDMRTIRLGYTWYGSEFWGSGLNKNCKYLLFDFAFSSLGVERIGLGAHAENIRSIAAMKSVGLQEEGLIRNLFPAISKSGRADAVLFGILKSEWEEEIKNQLNQNL